MDNTIAFGSTADDVEKRLTQRRQPIKGLEAKAHHVPIGIVKTCKEHLPSACYWKRGKLWTEYNMGKSYAGPND